MIDTVKYKLTVKAGTWYLRHGPGISYAVLGVVKGGTVYEDAEAANTNWYYIPGKSAYIGAGAVTAEEVENDNYLSIAITASRGDIAKLVTAVYSDTEQPTCRLVVNNCPAAVYEQILKTCDELDIVPEIGEHKQ